MDLERTIWLAALANAKKFKGKANPKALIGAVVKDYPDAKKDMSSLLSLIDEVVSKVNTLSLLAQEEKLLELDPIFFEKEQENKKARKAKANELPELLEAKEGEVVMRIPPGPSKYTHLGHAMSFLINYLYAKKYFGKVILRFDDTNPDADAQEYVDAIQTDCLEYLGMRVDKVVFASDDMEIFYAYVQELIEKGEAYCSDDTSEVIAAQRRALEPSKDREKTKEEHLQIWSDLKSGKNTTHAVRLKIDYAHKNAVMRDPIIMRSNHRTHYRQKDKYKVWPVYDFESAVEEGLLGVTHVLRSNEFDQRIELHNYIGNILGYPKVHYKHYGRYNVVGSTTKGREIKNLITSGNYVGWDDPRLVTLQALQRRGIIKEAFYVLAKQIGLSKTQTNLDFGVIAAVNRSLLDETAKRLFAIKDPVEISVSGLEGKEYFSLAYHPHAQKGERKLTATSQYYIEKEDHEAIPVGSIVRFIDAMNLKKMDDNTYEFQSFEHDKSLGAKLIHYVPKDGKEVKGEILLPDLKKITIIGEANLDTLHIGDVIQFERYAFCRLDAKENGRYSFWFTHE